MTTDQRGFGIVIGTKDSGAYEGGNFFLESFHVFAQEFLPHTASDAERAAAFDFDGDGASNELEWLAVTGPGSAGSVFRPAGFLFGQSFVVEFPTITGRRYTLQFSDDLQTGSWFDLTELNGANNVQSFTVPRQQPRRFFRVKVSAS